MSKNNIVDVQIVNVGTIVQFYPKTDRARNWFTENVQSEPWQWMRGRLCLCVDRNYASDLQNAIKEHGLFLG